MNTTKIEDFLDLPPVDSVDESFTYVEEEITHTIAVVDQISSSEKADASLTVVTDIDKLDQEFDDIAATALTSYNELMRVGGQVNDNAAGRIYETAAQMLASALDAKKAKKDSKLKRVELLIKKAKLELDSVGVKSNTNDQSTQKIDRNAMMQQIIDKNPELNPHPSKELKP